MAFGIPPIDTHGEFMIKVKIAAGKEWKEVEYKDGMRVEDVIKELKYHPASIALIRLNESPADKKSELKDGDELLLVPTVGGG